MIKVSLADVKPVSNKIKSTFDGKAVSSVVKTLPAVTLGAIAADTVDISTSKQKSADICAFWECTL